MDSIKEFYNEYIHLDHLLSDRKWLRSEIWINNFMENDYIIKFKNVGMIAKLDLTEKIFFMNLKTAKKIKNTFPNLGIRIFSNDKETFIK